MTEDLLRQCHQPHHRKSLGDLSSNSTIALAIEERAGQDKANHCRTVGVLEHAPEDLQRLRWADCRSIVCSFWPFEFLKGRIAQDDTGITQRLAKLARSENIGLLQAGPSRSRRHWRAAKINTRCPAQASTTTRSSSASCSTGRCSTM